MPLKTQSPKNPCQGCTHSCSGGSCDILVKVDPSKLILCQQAGYREVRYHCAQATGGVDHRAALRFYGLESWE
jgi:hypothetical protein